MLIPETKAVIHWHRTKKGVSRILVTSTQRNTHYRAFNSVTGALPFMDHWCGPNLNVRIAWDTIEEQGFDSEEVRVQALEQFSLIDTADWARAELALALHRGQSNEN